MRTLRTWVVLFLVLGGLLACPTPTEEVIPPMRDAGDEAFVHRLLPLMWGRQADSIREVEVLLQLLEQQGRAGLVRSMARHPDYVDRWQEFFLDSLFVNRTGERGNARCYGLSESEQDGPELAAFLRANAPEAGEFPSPWTMEDLIRSSLFYDDISPVYRANLFAQMAKDIPFQGLEAAAVVRENLFGIFEETYLNRQMSCLPCHNSEESRTGHSNAELDRTWEIPGLFEEALFGASEGRDALEVHAFFRKHGVLAGYNIFQPQYDETETGCFGSNGPGCQGCACEEEVCDQIPACCTNNWTQDCADLCRQSPAGCVPGLPEDFSGCTALYGYPGCGGCECEEAVCEMHAPCCEISWTEFCAERCRLLHPECVDEMPPEYIPQGIAVWGMHHSCGIFVAEGAGEDDPIGIPGYFAGDSGSDASVWQLERLLRQGFDSLLDGLDVGPDLSVASDEAFAWLVSSNIAEKVWTEAYGSGLTVAHHFPRNVEQRDILWDLTEVFVTSGASVAELLVAVTAHPMFNLDPPASMEDGETPYHLPAVIDPWVVDNEDLETRLNSLGDIVHRKSPRVLVHSATHAMGWQDWPRFPADSDVGSEGQFQEDSGFFLKDSVHGFRGNDFQGVTAWEYMFGACEVEYERADGCGPRLGPGCEGCACEEYVCAALPDCCEVRWDLQCASFCPDSPPGCQQPEEVPVPPPTWIERVLAAAPDEATLEDAVEAL
ncbi:MAG: hypothetical protein VX498_14475, partial [Myxococcota bacterium]|nr:hypothetical protein [Myxococcota bacterium]